MSAQRVVIIGNSASGKLTAAKKLAADEGLAHLDLDPIAWLPEDPPRRRPIDEAARTIEAFMDAHDGWVIEGCYADLVALALPRCTRLVFLNPGVEACVANARRRPWEPHKYESREAQDANLAMLIAWIRDYDRRDDVCSLKAHRRLFDELRGDKVELTAL